MKVEYTNFTENDFIQLIEKQRSFINEQLESIDTFIMKQKRLIQENIRLMEENIELKKLVPKLWFAKNAPVFEPKNPNSDLRY